ncbi:sugar ABC transporter permease [Marispirochaeta sp.]|uniref:carbohydrate ABC transporter permease n=1 Tax=Marispirochaeta sp. TaxID=2038653 RepID=UPI0029C69091|nr:sugar ABC transporter permease [Marispirochaeta sp.]
MRAFITHKRTPYLLLLPSFLAILLVIIYPAMRALSMSFLSYKLTRPNDINFIGFGNYLRALTDPVFWISLRNTVIYVSVSVGMQFILGLFLAIILRKGKRIHKIIQTLMLLPWVIPGILGAFMWRWMLNGNYGIINFTLKNMGLIREYVPWLVNTHLALPSVILVTVWRGMPFFAVTLTAGLHAVPDELIEAARIDGASRIQEFTKIIIPIIMPVIITTTLLRVIWTANYVDLIFLLTEGGPGYSTLVLPLYTYSVARNTLDYGYASTLAILLSALLIGVVILYFRQVKKQELV